MLFYVFIVRRADDLGAHGKSAFIVVSVMLIPVLGFTLWNQAQSKGRLEDLDFGLYQGLGASIGASVDMANDPTLLYSLSGSEEAVLEFCKQPENHKGWRLASETPRGLVFRGGASQMRLHVSNGKVAFLLFRTGEAKPDKTLEPGT